MKQTMASFLHHPKRKPILSSSQLSRFSIHGAVNPFSNYQKLDEAIKSLKTERKVETRACVQLLDSCIGLKALNQGLQIHGYINSCKNLCKNALILEKLTIFYITVGEFELGRSVFNTITKPTVFLFNFVIRSYAWNTPMDEALTLYYKMLELGVKPNKFTFPFALKACSGLLSLEDGQNIHGDAVNCGLEGDVFVATALIDMYSKCGNLGEARAVFDKMIKRDIVAWNAMISGLAFHGFSTDAIVLLHELQRANEKPNPSTLASVLPAFGQVLALRHGKAAHAYCIRRCFVNDVMVGTALLDMYSKCENLNYASKIFMTMHDRNEVTWSAMISGYAHCDHPKEALNLFDRMLHYYDQRPTTATLASVLRASARLLDVKRGKEIHSFSIKAGFVLDLTVSNSILSMYAKCGYMDQAIEFFYEMLVRDSVSYSAIISGCAQNGHAKEALHIFREMQMQGYEPELATMVGVIPACAHLAALKHGQCSHSYVIIHEFSNEISVGNALVDMYAKCGSISSGRAVFDRMPKRDVVSWNSIIAGYGVHGHGKEALSLFMEMQASGVKPDDITFVCLLSACSHSGLVSEGEQLFKMMGLDFGITPRMEHYICFVDLLGRVGHLQEAHNFIRSMPVEPDVRVWGALLGACRIHSNLELGEKVSKIIRELGPEGSGNFVLLSNIYSAEKRWEDAAFVRITQRDQGFRKSPGCSWIEIGGSIHAFVGGDRSHQQSVMIYEKLEELLREIKELGYRPDTSFVLHDVEEEERERILLYHSEKLAIAFGVLNLGPGKPIQITKNLRVCGDCHTAIKLISIVVEADVVVRDANRFHHFRSGICSCGDFW
ncbi:pentatricopeptide repeat-containing protein At3g16610 [Amborella trichopoda]|uniref:pentatricopeptide repeat-containing protein At3g16610 n=1 Tax=Amborella trichopoda TaxID=13333 RepID=UPI0009C0BC7F|nr:pentatricopeptide repeat-containing protein At3g16610 [Amborella trichopoda]|eukprot:XP_011623452.2 pentatricopeptide repeat-containing protein At3g16610 [Amborella trichopoda]